jgi:hypothetical protein
MCGVSELDKREEATLLWVARNAVVHDEKGIWTSADWLHYVGEDGQSGHQSPSFLPKLLHYGAVRCRR